MPKPIRTTNSACRPYVQSRTPFTNSNNQLFARWASPNLYVVYSYGPHWPLFIYSADLDRWYANEDKASRTTSHHYSYAHPHTTYPTPPAKRTCAWMRQAVTDGLAFILLSECTEHTEAA